MRWPRAVGVFLEFRMIPVLLWSFTAVMLGTAVAFFETGRFDLTWFLAAMFLGAVVQGFVTHSLNEIYDWRSGTDRHASPRLLSGGSKVLNAGLLSERGLWGILAVSSAAVFSVAAAVMLLRSPWIAVFVVPGYLCGVAYTTPPVRLVYRPFVSEWLGGFVGVLLAGTGAYFIQALTVSPLALLVASAHACTCVGMLLVHHYADVAADAAASPRKETTVVRLGAARAKGYATVLAGFALVLTAIAGVAAWPFLLALPVLAGVLVLHHRTRPTELPSVTANEIGVIQGGIVAGLVPSALLAPYLIVPALLAVPAYAAHFWLATSPDITARIEASRLAAKG